MHTQNAGNSLSVLFSGKGCSWKSAMIVVFAVNTLPNAGSAFTLCMFFRSHIVSIFYNPLTLGMTTLGDLPAGNIWSKLKFRRKFILKKFVKIRMRIVYYLPMKKNRHQNLFYFVMIHKEHIFYITLYSGKHFYLNTFKWNATEFINVFIS